MRAVVKITAPKFTIVGQLGAEPSHPTDGLGGWDTEERPSNVSITEWNGADPIRMDLPLLFDGYSTDSPVDQDYSRILRLGRKRDGTERPPIFRVSGPIPFSGERFVVENTPDFADTIKNDAGQLLRFSVVLPLLEYVSAERVKFTKKARYRQFYTVKKGENLRKIAVKLYKDASKAQKIGKLNGIRDTRRELKVGLKLRLTDEVGFMEVEGPL